MGCSILPEVPQVTEPSPVRDMFACGLHGVEVLGPCARFMFYADRPRIFECENAIEHALLEHALVIPIAQVPAVIRRTTYALGQFWHKGTTRNLLTPL